MESLCLWACMAKGPNKKLQKRNRHWSCLMCIEEEKEKKLLFFFFANAGFSHTKSDISQLSGLSYPVQWLSQAFVCIVSSPLSKDVWAERAEIRARQGSSWEEDPAVTNLAQCLFLKRQCQGWWCWRPAVPQLHLSHLDDANPRASPKIHVFVCNHHWSFKAEATLPALALLPCECYLICLFPNSLSPAIIPKINWT